MATGVDKDLPSFRNEMIARLPGFTIGSLLGFGGAHLVYSGKKFKFHGISLLGRGLILYGVGVYGVCYYIQPPSK